MPENNISFRLLPLATRIFVLFLFVITIINLGFLDYVFLNLKSEKQTVVTSVSPLIATEPAPVNNVVVCPQSCLEQIRSVTSLILTKTPTPTTTLITPTTSSKVVSSAVKEFFVPFGSGINSASDWQDVSGLQATIDTGNYNKIKSVVFEASVRIPTGNQTASVRLFNASDKHPVWFSEVSVSGGTAQLATSQPLTLDSGSKTYQVQMKTSLQYQAILDQARLHIIIY